MELLYENNKFATWNEINIDNILDKMLKKKTWEGIRGMWIVDGYRTWHFTATPCQNVDQWEYTTKYFPPIRDSHE